MKVGDKVMGSHGRGVVVALNPNKPNDGFKYVMEHLGEDAPSAMITAGLVNMDSFYTVDKYPFVVKFEDGYQDVYAESELMTA